MLPHKPIETVADAERRARRRIPKPIFTAIKAGNERGWTYDNNVDAFTQIGFQPRVGTEVALTRDQRTTFLGQEISLDAGADAVGVSNHGGNNLDTTPAPLRFLPGVVAAVGDQAEVSFDSGIRRGADVVKALALGAKVGLVGRSWFFGLAADGERGVSEVLDAYRLSIDRTLTGLGKSSIHELNPDDVIVPDGFFLRDAAELPIAAA